MAEGQIPPEKLYFKIGEAAKIVGVKPYVLRYWETEFAELRPGKTRSKHRLYKRKDVETLLEIKRLLHDQRFTIEGARKYLKEGRSGQAESAAGTTPEAATLREIRDGLLDLRDVLS